MSFGINEGWRYQDEAKGSSFSTKAKFEVKAKANSRSNVLKCSLSLGVPRSLGP